MSSSSTEPHLHPTAATERKYRASPSHLNEHRPPRQSWQKKHTALLHNHDHTEAMDTSEPHHQQDHHHHTIEQDRHPLHANHVQRRHLPPTAASITLNIFHGCFTREHGSATHNMLSTMSTETPRLAVSFVRHHQRHHERHRPAIFISPLSSKHLQQHDQLPLLHAISMTISSSSFASSSPCFHLHASV